MPIYLVRWPDLSVSLVQARDEDELRFTLDEIDDPGGCRWKVYNGPLFLDLELDARFEMKRPEPGAVPLPQDFSFEGLDELREEPRFKLTEGGETTYEMWEDILSWAFPHLHAYYERAYESEDEEANAKELADALRKELRRVTAYHLRRRQQ